MSFNSQKCCTCSLIHIKQHALPLGTTIGGNGIRYHCCTNYSGSHFTIDTNTHATAQTHRKSSSRSFDPGRRSSTGYSCALSKSKQSNATLIVGIIPLRRWPWRHNTAAIFPATSKLRLAVIAVALHSWTSFDTHTRLFGYEKHSQVTNLHLIL